MSELQSQRLWKPTRMNGKRQKRGKSTVTSTIQRAGTIHKPFKSTSRSAVTPGDGRRSKSNFNKYHEQHEHKPPNGSLQSLSAHSIPKPTPRAHTSLGFRRQGPPHLSYNHQQLHSQSSQQISANQSNTSGRKSLRAHSSLGFTWQGPTHNYEPLQMPQGFDIARYIQQQGVDSEIHIGVNGRECQDEYLLSYLKECRKQVSLEDGEEETWCSDDDDIIMMSSGIGMGLAKDVPLCWDDQLRKAEPSTIKNTNHDSHRNHSTMTRTHHMPQNTDSKKQDQIIQKLLQQTDTVSVTATWECSSCLMETTSLEKLREGKMTYIPQPECQTKTQEVSCEWSNVSIATVQPCTEGEQVDAPVGDDEWASFGSERVRDLVQSLLKIAPELSAINLLCIWFRTTNAEILEMSALDFDVFVTTTSTRVFSKVKAINVSDSRAVIPLSLEQGTERDKMTICLMCGTPRSILFTVKLKQPPPSSVLTALQESPAVSMEGDDKEQTNNSTKFFKQRSYVKPEEDEDKTDMEALVKNFPDLMLLDLVEHETTPPILSPVHQHVMKLNSMVTSSKGKPLSLNSPMEQPLVEAHSVMYNSTDAQHEGRPLSSTAITMPTQFTSEPLSSTAITMPTQLTTESLSSMSSMTTQVESEPLSSRHNNQITVPSSESTNDHCKFKYTHSIKPHATNNQEVRPLYRPNKEVGSTGTRKSFVSIAEQWFGQYV